MESCPSGALLFNLDCDPHQRLRSYDEVNVYLCLTCGSPVFRDDDDAQERDLTSSFCLDCFSMFDSKDSSFYDDTGLQDDASMTDYMDDEYDDADHEVCNYFHVSCHASSTTLDGHALPSSSMSFRSLTGGKATA